MELIETIVLTVLAFIIAIIIILILEYFNWDADGYACAYCKQSRCEFYNTCKDTWDYYIANTDRWQRIIDRFNRIQVPKR